jgi:hypothetical protein
MKSDPDDLDYKKYSHDTLDVQAGDIKALFANLNRTAALFYPASGLNWQPIHSFHDQCDLFVYSDWTTPRAAFNKAIEQLDHPSFSEQPDPYLSKLVEDNVRQLPSMTHLPWTVASPDDFPIEPWCDLVKLSYRDGDTARSVWLLFIAGNPSETYRKVFTQNQTAPKLVYLSQPVGVPAEAWAAFVANGGPLATVIQENPLRPLHVLNDIGGAALA